jgi:hypothetical protein
LLSTLLLQPVECGLDVVENAMMRGKEGEIHPPQLVENVHHVDLTVFSLIEDLRANSLFV